MKKKYIEPAMRCIKLDDTYLLCDSPSFQYYEDEASEVIG